MNRVEPFTLDVQGFAACGLRNRDLELTIVPELGARVASLRTSGSREWMWCPEGSLRLFRNSTGDPFQRGTLCGADECLPTVAACELDGRSLPDHGEVWSSAWELDAAALDEGALRTSVCLPVSPLRFERRIRLEGPAAVFDYELHNLSSEAQRFLWAFHPLFAIESGDAIELPGTIREVVVGASAGAVRLASGATVSWPEPQPGLRLDQPGLAGDGYAKLFADFTGLEDGRAAIRRGRERLVFSFSPRELPYLGIWFTRRHWEGHTHMALESATAPTDSAAAQAGSIPPHGVRRWSFRLRYEA